MSVQGRPERPRRTIGRRPIFFAIAALLCVALVPAAPPDLRWVAWATAGLGGFWAVLLALEDLTAVPRERRRGTEVRFEAAVAPETPFPPPEPPSAGRGRRRRHGPS
jgi:hypothetical protein